VFYLFPDTISCCVIFVAGSGKKVHLFVHPFIILSGLITSSVSFTIIEDIAAMCKAGQASMAYFDFEHDNKQHSYKLIPSLLVQLSPYPHPHCNILSRLYEAHDSGKAQPSDVVLVKYLKHMLFSLPDRRPTYLVMGSLNECPGSSGISSPRKRVLQLVKELVDLRLPNLHICVMSNPEFDIRGVLEPLASFQISLHNGGHVQVEF